MTETVEIQSVAGQCPVCQHPPIRHVQDGTGYTCLVCLFLAAEDAKQGRLHRVCTLKFEFKLSEREREQAAQADKEAYPAMTVCAECDCTWQAHAGYLCPTGDNTFVPLLDKDVPYIHMS